VAVAAPAALLLRSDQSLGLPESESGTSAQLSSGMAVATAAAELPPSGGPAAPVEHVLHHGACSQTSIESTHTLNKSDSTVFQHKKICMKKFLALNN
jgi:hypothetical protein